MLPNGFTAKQPYEKIIVMDILHKKIRSLTLKQIAYTLAAADAGNVSAAARSLNVSQPAISSAIQALEELFGIRLFIRHPGQGMTLTSFGATAMREARALLEQVESFSSLADPDSAPQGQVVICCDRILGPLYLPRLLADLAERIPTVAIRFLEEGAEGIEDRLRRDNADFAIGFDLSVAPDVESLPLVSLEAVVLCPMDHPFTRRDTLPLSALKGEPLVGLDQPGNPIATLRGMGIDAPVAVQTRELEMQRALVANGFGVAVTYTSPHSSYAQDGKAVVAIPLREGSLPPLPIALSRLRQPRYHPAVTAVFDATLAHFQDMPAAAEDQTKT